MNEFILLGMRQLKVLDVDARLNFKTLTEKFLSILSHSIRVEGKKEFVKKKTFDN